MQIQSTKKEHVEIKAPNFIRLGASFVYDTLVVIALCFVCAWIYILLLGNATYGLKRYCLQLFIWLTVGLYFIRCWSKSGQTVAMKTWRIQLLSHSGLLVSIKTAVLRYVLATLSLTIFGLGFLWAIIDEDGLFLHDRLLQCNIKFAPKTSTFNTE